MFLSHFLFYNSYLDALSNNFLRIVRHLGTNVAGDEKLSRFFGESDDVRVFFSKPDRVGLWFHQLASALSNGLTYMVHLRLHDVRQLEEGSLPVIRGRNVVSTCTWWPLHGQRCRHPTCD